MQEQHCFELVAEQEYMNNFQAKPIVTLTYFQTELIYLQTELIIVLIPL